MYTQRQTGVRTRGLRIWGLILLNLLMNGFTVILVKNYFDNNIPKDLIEAAEVDGVYGDCSGGDSVGMAD
ncbi:MAG: hypothetical protein LIP11_16500 [Clostridiales bacterium]|nr:hypothetical protein [Clostridiales bacterium]